MDELDSIISEKEFFRIDNLEIEKFLTERKRLEDDVIEFKEDFERNKNGKIKILDFCKYIVAFSNSIAGGFIFYGVKDNIKDKKVTFPNYIGGITIENEDEILLKLQGWIKERIHRKVYVPIRIFDIASKKILVVKIPPGKRKPYAYYDPSAKSYIYIRKSTGRIDFLKLEEIESLYYENLVESANKLQSLNSHSPKESRNAIKDRIKSHQEYIIPKLENIKDYGYWYLYCYPNKTVSIEEKHLKVTFLDISKKYCEALNLSPNTETIQEGYSRGYFPDMIREDIKSTCRTTCYNNGFIALDSQVDITLENNNLINLHSFTYYIQRHLQLCKEILESYCDEVHYWLNFEYINSFSVPIGGSFVREKYSYQGYHKPIKGIVKIANIPGRDLWNKASPTVIEIVRKIARIFGLRDLPTGILDSEGIINYSKDPIR